MKNSQLTQEIAELQHRAEQRLSEQRPEGVIQDSDIHTLLHRLRVHQIELEMQNEALQQAREETEAALERYTKLYDFAPIGYFTLDRDGTILQVNLAGADLLGIERSHLIGKHFGLFVGPQDRPALDNMLTRLFSSHDNASCELTLNAAGEFPRFVSIKTNIHPSEQIICHAVVLDITEQKQAEATIWRQANYDLLTGLPNRPLFQDRLRQGIGKAQRNGLSLALLYIDLDRFKEVNDSLGHDAGDVLLVEAAGRIGACIRHTDTTARLGGDEFAVIIADLVETDRVSEAARQIIETLTEPFLIGVRTVQISASIGIALYPADATDMKELLTHADQAMYAAKAAGRSRFSYFAPQMQADALARLALIQELRTALTSRQFEVYFQPIIDLATGRLSKAEALLRWHHPDQGTINAAQFIALAEKSGLIGEIDDWVFQQSVSMAKRWDVSHPPGEGSIQINVNESSHGFFAGKTIDIWTEHLRKVGLPPNRVFIEITGNLLVEENHRIQERLLQCRDSGIQVALGKFCLSHELITAIEQCHIDYLKIESSLIRNMTFHQENRTIVESIVSIAHKLGIRAIAEGVETAAQRDLLVAAGCDYAQGYLFGMPVPEKDLRLE